MRLRAGFPSLKIDNNSRLECPRYELTCRLQLQGPASNGSLPLIPDS